MNHFVILLLVLALVCTLGARATAEDSPQSADPRPLVDGNNGFACDLYGVLRGVPGNKFFSPYSISLALGLVRHGAKGETAAEIDKAMRFPTVGFADQHISWQSALEPGQVREHDGRQLVEVPAYELRTANGFFAQSGYPLETAYTDTLTRSHGVEAHRLDFQKAKEARAFINDWVEQKTKDRIKDLVPPGMPTPDTRLVLANAVYFKASWKDPFHERATEDGTFTGRDGAEHEARFMRNTKSYRYADLGDAQLVEIPYKGREMGMVVVLPKAKNGLAALEEKLKPGALDAWLQKAKHKRVQLRFPRFEFTEPTDLTSLLQRLGMRKAFSASEADFSGMTKAEPLFIGAVLHKAFIAVDEKGTEAAAATVVMMRAGSAPPTDEPVVFNADHPFLFFIRHAKTGTLLFMGRLEDPTK